MWKLAYFQMAGSGKQRNQDALFNGQEVYYALLRKTRVLNFSDELTVRLAISDGVFSSPAPHLASRFWMQTFMQYGDESGRFLRQYHGKFCDEMIESHFVGSAATFVSAITMPDGRCYICNVGDSRAYRISVNGRWQQVSHDHTLLAEFIEQGQAQIGQSYAGIYDALAQCLIADSNENDFRIFTTSFVLQAGETILLCSDGLSDALNHDEIELIWNRHLAVEERLEALRKRIQKQAQYDDCSVVCAHYYQKIQPEQ